MNYYNEHDPKAAAWLRELIAAGEIPQGEVDERSITEVQPHEIIEFTQCHFFAGIAGWSEALRLAGWPADRPVWTGSCPCQPFSAAGKQLGDRDERHLWPAFFALIRECRPSTVIGEQVASSEVIGRRATNKAVRQMLDRKIVLGILRGQSRTPAEFLQRLQESGPVKTTEAGLCSAPDYQARIDSCVGGKVSRDQGGDSLRSGRGGNTETNRIRGVRVDGSSIRPNEAEGLELPLSGSDNTERRLHSGECKGGDLRNQRDEPHLGAEFGPEDCGLDQESAAREIQCFIEQLGEGAEEASAVWLDGIHDDLEGIGYACGASVVAASSVGAPHRRQRLFWVAYGQRAGLEGHAGDGCNGHEPGRERADASGSTAESGGLGEPHGYGRDQARRSESATGHDGTFRAGGPGFWDEFALIGFTGAEAGKTRRIESGTLPLVDGLPRGVVSGGDPSPAQAQASAESRVARLRGYGNAIVPPLAAEFIGSFLDLEVACGATCGSTERTAL